MLYIFNHLLQNAQYSKLEKADILELTVKHLRHVQRHQMAGNYIACYCTNINAVCVCVCVCVCVLHQCSFFYTC